MAHSSLREQAHRQGRPERSPEVPVQIAQQHRQARALRTTITAISCRRRRLIPASV
jgi:hypothetical protein